MKAAAFDYLRASDAGDIDQAKAEGGEDARILAGGQSLVPMMAMRLLRPELLIDINRVPALAEVALQDEALSIAAAVRQAAILADARAGAAVPMLARALNWVGHGQTRNRGTLCGSLAHADPAAELPLVAVLLDATMQVRRRGDRRTVAAAAFFRDEMTTALGDEEWLESVAFPRWPGPVGCGFHEINQRRSDFAIAAAAAQVSLDDGGRIARIVLAVGGCGPVPVRCRASEDALLGEQPDARIVNEACALIGAELDPGNDLQADAAYRRRVAPELARRALADALSEARSASTADTGATGA